MCYVTGSDIRGDGGAGILAAPVHVQLAPEFLSLLPGTAGLHARCLPRVLRADAQQRRPQVIPRVPFHDASADCSSGYYFETSRA